MCYIVGHGDEERPMVPVLLKLTFWRERQKRDIHMKIETSAPNQNDKTKCNSNKKKIHMFEYIVK